MDDSLNCNILYFISSFFPPFLFSTHMALRGAVTRLLSNSPKCAAVIASRAQGTAAAAPKGTFEIHEFFKCIDRKGKIKFGVTFSFRKIAKFLDVGHTIFFFSPIRTQEAYKLFINLSMMM